jgi:hypothetical protein
MRSVRCSRSARKPESVFDQVAENVQFASRVGGHSISAVVDRGDLDRRHDGDAVLGAGL